MRKVFYILIGALLSMILLYIFMPKAMIKKTESPYSFDNTVSKITENVKAEGWSLMGIKRVDKSIEKHGHQADTKVALIEICHPEYAAKMINDTASAHISVMMPCTIAVYETSNQKVYISTMNVKPMSWVFGGTVKEVMGGPVAEAQQRFITLQ